MNIAAVTMTLAVALTPGVVYLIWILRSFDREEKSHDEGHVRADRRERNWYPDAGVSCKE